MRGPIARARSSTSSWPVRGRNAHRPDRQAALARHLPPRVGVRVVVELGHDDLVARCPLAGERAAEMERQRRHVRPEGDLRRLAAEEVGEGLACAGERGVGLDARRVRPVGVRVVVEEVVGHRVDDRDRDLGPAGPVEVRDGRAAVAAIEGGEVRADRVDGDDGFGRRGGEAHVGHLAGSIPFLGRPADRRRGGDAPLAEPVQHHDRPARAGERSVEAVEREDRVARREGHRSGEAEPRGAAGVRPPTRAADRHIIVADDHVGR